MRRIAILVLAASLILTGCSGDQRVTSLKVGDCFNHTTELLTSGEVTRGPSVSCTQSHDNEVFHLARYSGPSYDENRIDDFSAGVCYSAFEPYVGRSYETSALEIGWLMPTADSWSQGDREVICILFDMNLQRLLRSARGSGM